MQQYRIHAKRVSDEACVLATRAAKAIERVSRHVIAARHGYFLDRFSHARHGDFNATVGDSVRRGAIADAFCKLRKGCAHALSIEALTPEEAGLDRSA